MSLQIWLPLDGKNNNQGLLSPNLIESSVLYEGQGKISAKAFSNGTITIPAESISKIFNNEHISICFWIYINAEDGISNSTNFFGNSSMAAPNNRKFTLFTYPTINDLHYSWQNNETNKTFVGGVLYDILPSYKWTHVAITYENPKGTIYINGQQQTTFTGISASSSFSFDTSICKSSGLHYINDFRLYDHCLSKKEVQEISKGLILHYPLDSNGLGNDNLITTMSSGGRTTLVDAYTLDADFSQNKDTYGRFHVSPALEYDKTYTLSFNVDNFPEGSEWSWWLWNKSNYSFIVNKNGYYTYTFTPKESILSSIENALTIFLFDDGSRTNPANIVRFSNFKIEEGAKATSWVPHRENELYQSYNPNPLLIEDVSGYNNNGTMVQEMKISSNSPRNNCSTVWSNNTNFIHIPALFSFGQEVPELTICGWFKTNTINGTAPGLFNFGYNYFIRGRITQSNTNAGLWVIARNGGTINQSQLTASAGYHLADGNWHHYAYVFDNGILKIYIDGKLKATADKSSYGTNLIVGETSSSGAQNGMTNWGLGGATPTGEKFLGNQSDFRVYIQALTDNEILEIFEGRPAIDKNNNFYICHLDEISTPENPIITKTCTASIPDSFIESDSFYIDKKDIQSNYFYENY